MFTGGTIWILTHGQIITNHEKRLSPDFVVACLSSVGWSTALGGANWFQHSQASGSKPNLLVR